jgi:hypothetical protein
MKTFDKFLTEMAGAYTLQQAIQTLDVLAERLQTTTEEDFAAIADEFTSHISSLYKIVGAAHDQSAMTQNPSPH